MWSNEAGIRNNRAVRWLYIFLAGFFLGILMINAGRDIFLNGTDLLSTVVLGRLRYLTIDSTLFFGYVMKERLFMAVLICFLGTTYMGYLVISGYVLWFGMAAGVFLSAAAVRYGMKGMILVLGSMFPQYLLLVPVCIMLLAWCDQICAVLYSGNPMHEAVFGGRRQYLLYKVPKLILILVLLVIACVLESYVNPVVLTGLLRLFW